MDTVQASEDLGVVHAPGAVGLDARIPLHQALEHAIPLGEATLQHQGAVGEADPEHDRSPSRDLGAAITAWQPWAPGVALLACHTHAYL